MSFSRSIGAVCLAGLLALFAYTDIDSITGRLRQAEMYRLEAAGFKVVLLDGNGGCLHPDLPKNIFVLFCFSDTGVSLYPGETWSVAVTPEEEEVLVSRWVRGFLSSGEHEMARFGAVRVATLVARDILNAPLNEPLTPMLPPEKMGQRIGRPSLEHRLGIATAFLVFVLCLLIANKRDRGRNMQL